LPACRRCRRRRRLLGRLVVHSADLLVAVHAGLWEQLQLACSAQAPSLLSPLLELQRRRRTQVLVPKGAEAGGGAAGEAALRLAQMGQGRR
jgi:hypothetical protein